MFLIKPNYKILTGIDSSTILENIERAGRICYKSEKSITSSSAKEFVRKIIKSGHESVIEHEFLSIKFICDRGVSHELVRHRLCSFSQESTRYCDYNGGVTFIIPQWSNLSEGLYKKDFLQKVPEKEYSSYPTYFQDSIWLEAMVKAEELYLSLLKYNWLPQQARAVLPNSLKTELVITANLREWRLILKQRTSKAAHPQMRELMIPLLKELKSSVSVVFEDIEGGE